MRRFVPILVVVIVVAVLGIWISGCGRSITSSTDSATSEDRIQALKTQIAEQEVESAQSVAEYEPTINSRIDDLGSPVVKLSQRLPGVEVGVKAETPTQRIVHLRDWHFIPKDLFTLDMNEVHDRVLNDEEIDSLYQEFILEVELVQVEQMSALRCLIEHHGLRRVFPVGRGLGQATHRRNANHARPLPTGASRWRSQFQGVLGAEADLIRNIHGVAAVADLDADEVGYLFGRVAKIKGIG